MKYHKITKVLNNPQQNNLEAITNEHDKKVPKEKTYLQKKDKTLLLNLDINIMV